MLALSLYLRQPLATDFHQFWHLISFLVCPDVPVMKIYIIFSSSFILTCLMFLRIILSSLDDKLIIVTSRQFRELHKREALSATSNEKVIKCGISLSTEFHHLKNVHVQTCKNSLQSFRKSFYLWLLSDSCIVTYNNNELDNLRWYYEIKSKSELWLWDLMPWSFIIKEESSQHEFNIIIIII